MKTSMIIELVFAFSNSAKSCKSVVYLSLRPDVLKDKAKDQTKHQAKENVLANCGKLKTITFSFVKLSRFALVHTAFECF